MDTTQRDSPGKRNGTPAPLRGTQSLVGVMGAVWKQPSLTALEVLWRWMAAAPLLWLLWITGAPRMLQVPHDTAALESMTFLEPVRSAGVLAHLGQLYGPVLLRLLRWWVPLALCVWSALAGLGRTATLRRADPMLKVRLPPALLFTFLRALSFFLLLAFLAISVWAAVGATILRPPLHGSEPNVVLLTAVVVGLTLFAFLLWSVLVWALDLAPLRAMTGVAALSGSQRKLLRGKLIETNLVMGIVRVALLVLAMTFSASPLPFQSQETQGFITLWWIGVGLLYLLTSDFFHVVRRVTYLRLLQSVAAQAKASDHAES